MVAPIKVKGPISISACAPRGLLADDDVELVILKRGVKFFFEHRLHAMDFVEEKHLALAQVGEDGGKVALNLKRGAGGLLKSHVQFIRNNCGECGFAQTRRLR